MSSGNPNRVMSAKKCSVPDVLLTGWQEIQRVPVADRTLRQEKSLELLTITWKGPKSAVRLPAATQLLDILMQPLISETITLQMHVNLWQ